MRKLSVIFFLVLLTSCSSIRPIETGRYDRDREASVCVLDLDTFEENYSKKKCSHIEKVIKQPIVPQVKIETISKITVNKKIEKTGKLKLKFTKKYYKFWVKYFSGKNKERFQRHMNNGQKYKKIVENILEKYNLPKELYYVGLIESGFNSSIRSKAGAKGHWQFMKGTAKQYGLVINKSVDERYNIYKSTEAAAKYFRDIYNIFGSWELTLSAYNAGPYRVIGAIKRGRTRDYLTLVKKKYLPKETAYYIPKIVAAREIESNVSKYGFYKKRQKGAFSVAHKSVNMRQNFKISTVSKKLGMSLSALKRLNPDLLHRYVKVGRSGHKLYVPKFLSTNNVRNYLTKAKARKPSSKRYSKRGKRVKDQKIRVKSGDSLYAIARRFNTSIRELKKLNRIKGSILKIGQRLKVPNGNFKIYVVRKGDNLSRIAKNFGISIKSIISSNRLRNKIIYPRQKLFIPKSS